MFDEDGLGNYGTDAAWTRKSGNGRDEMDEKDQEIAHCRIVARKPKTRGIQDKLAIRHGQEVSRAQIQRGLNSEYSVFAYRFFETKEVDAPASVAGD